MTTDVSEEQQSLWRLVAAPAVWAAHFLLSYCTAAVWCAKFSTQGGSFSNVRAAIGLYTLVALVLIAAIGWSGWRRHKHNDSTLPRDADSAPSRHRFLGFATLLLAGLSAVSVSYQALPAVFIRSCQ